MKKLLKLVVSVILFLIQTVKAQPDLTITGTSVTQVAIRLENQQLLIGNRKVLSTSNTNPTINVSIVYEFLGLPFAQPPIGNKRFKPPQSINYLLPSSIYDATFERPSCIQAPLFPGKIYHEDCLYLNIWVPVNPKQDELIYFNNSLRFANNLWKRLRFLNGAFIDSDNLKTTMYWIYGGGFDSGYSIDLNTDGTNLASLENVIVASSNYRINVFGFLYLNDSKVTGNQGISDQMMAIKWYKEKYASFFGARASHLCLFGESAGAMSIHFQMLSQTPNSPQLFNRVILESGSYIQSPRTPSQQLYVSLELAKRVKCNDPLTMLTCLQALNTSVLLSNQLGLPGSLPWTPIIESQPAINFNGDILLGINQNQNQIKSK